jgi:hypothetical protein
MRKFSVKNISLPKDLWAELEKRREEMGIPVSAQIRKALTQTFKSAKQIRKELGLHDGKMKRGQLGIMGIIYMFIEIAIFVVIYPIQQEFLNNITLDPATSSGVKLILAAIPLIEVICIAITPIVYARIARGGGDQPIM